MFTLDPRSLAVLRVGLGVHLLVHLTLLLPDVPAFFTDAGFLPRDARVRLTAEEESTFPPYWVSPHMLSGGATLQYALFAVAAGLAVAVAAGYRTRAAVFGSWVLVVGLQARNPMAFHGGDMLLRCLLFWCLFLPLGARWSLDARRRPGPAGPVYSLASAGLVVQLACVYLATAIAKDDPAWREDFTALHYALHSDLFTTRIGHALTAYPGLLRGLTAGALWLELLGPLVLLCPWGGWRARVAVVAGFWGLHLGIASTMNLGLFPYTCLLYWAAVLPGGFWDALARWRRGAAPAADAPAAAADRLSWAGRVLLAVALAYVVLVTVVRTRAGPAAPVPGPLGALGRAAHLDQSWYMFAPRPHDFGGWFDVVGTLPDGSRVSLLEGTRPPRAARPDLPTALWPSMAWRRVLLTLCECGDCPNVRRGVTDWFRRAWDDAHPAAARLTVVEVVAAMEPTPPPGGPRDPAAARVLVLARWDVRAGSDQPAVPYTQGPLSGPAGPVPPGG